MSYKVGDILIYHKRDIYFDSIRLVMAVEPTGYQLGFLSNPNSPPFFWEQCVVDELFTKLPETLALLFGDL